jgi:Na+-driven multidrug efflux pump
MALTIVFLKKYGGIGAAYATIIYYSVTMITMLVVLKKYINIEAGNILRYTWKRYSDVLRFFQLDRRMKDQ